MVWSLPKVRKVLITLQPQAGLWDAYYSNITVLSLPKVRHGPPHAATVDQKLATWRHTTAISWLCVFKRFANVLPTLQQLTKSWPLGGIIQQYHGLEFAKSLPTSSSQCNSCPKAETTAVSWSGVCQKFAKVLLTLQQLIKSCPLGGILRQYHGLEIAKSSPRSPSCCNS